MALAIAPAVHASEVAAIPADYTIAPLTVEQYHVGRLAVRDLLP